VGRPFLQILLATLLCAAGVWFAYKVWGPFIIVFAAPLYGALVARPIINLVEESNYSAKAGILEEFQGKWYEHRGHRIDIAEDVERARWLLTAHVRKVVKALPRDEVLERQFGERAGHVETFAGFRIRADALAEYLRKSTDSQSLKFKVWLDREILGGANNPRAR
jgi:hypothetical protein